jgi:mannose-6-phosphate isomerase
VSALRGHAERLGGWLAADALPLWWRAGADRTVGGFHEGLELDGRPTLAPRRARVQARQVYVYAAAGGLPWGGESREAVEHGLDFLLGRYRRPDGLLRTLVAADGAPADETAMLYDQAFGLFALAAARKIAPDRADLEPAALGILAALEAGRRHAAGGFVEEGAAPYQANAHMHLFEACLAWREVSDAPVWDALADEIAALALTRFIDPAGGFLREFFDADWRPAPGDAGRLIEPGHQFEWAWLMERWSRLRGRADARTAAERLYAAGLAGVDRARGVAIDGLWDDLTVRDLGARLWPQTERLKATLALAADDVAEVQAAVDGLALYLDVPLRGLWRDKLRPDGAFVEEFAPASSFYHIACAILALREAAG